MLCYARPRSCKFDLCPDDKPVQNTAKSHLLAQFFLMSMVDSLYFPHLCFDLLDFLCSWVGT